MLQRLASPCAMCISATDAEALVPAIVCRRWLEEQSPGVPPKVGKRVVDDGRAEFTLSRTRQNWRRLIALHAALAPAAAAFAHVCSWESPLHSSAVVSAILLLGLYPSQVSGLKLIK